jgi:solute carrier family 40 (iron-regulated transporter), member 1
MWSVVYQFIFISLSMASFFLWNYNTSMAMLIFGVCASRIGLWVFDIAVTQLMQEFIPEGIRGAVGGTQQALNAFFQLSSFTLGFLFPSARDFPIYALPGYIAVFISAVVYFVFVYVQREDFSTHHDVIRNAA